MPKITTSTTINLAKSIKSNITSNETVGLATTSLAGFPTTRINTNGFTVSFWVKLDGTSTTVRHVYHDDTRTGVHGGVWFESTRLYFRAVNSGGTYGRYWSINYADYQEWVHVAITWDGDMNNGNTELFVNGVSEGAGTNALGTTSGTTQAITDLYIFDKYTTTTINGFELQGALVDFAMWSKEYSSVQIQNIYGGGEFVDYSALGGIYTPQLILWYRLGEESTISSLTTGDSLSAGTQFAAAYTQSGVSGATLTAQSNIDMEIVEGPYNVTTTTTTIYSGITSDTPRRTLRAKDAVSGQYPTIARTGDSSRMGNFNINFDDRNTIVFEENTTLLEYPHLGIYQSSHPLLKSNASAHSTTNSGVIVTTGSLVKGVSDDYLLKGDRVLIGSRLENDLIANGEALSGSVNITPFDESRISLGTSTFYMTGTAEDVYPGFSSRLHDKTQIVIDISADDDQNSKIGYVNKGNNINIFNDSSTSKNKIMAYYNPSRKSWEPIAEGYNNTNNAQTSAALKQMIERAAVGFSAHLNNNQVATSSLTADSTDSAEVNLARINSTIFNNQVLDNVSRPISTFGFPFASKYHATGSQTIKMSDYINQPILVEKIKIEFKSEHEYAAQNFGGGNGFSGMGALRFGYSATNGYYPSATGYFEHGTMINHYNFFILRQSNSQRKYSYTAVSGSNYSNATNNINGGSDVISEDDYPFSAFLGGGPAQTVFSSREMITYSQLTEFITSSEGDALDLSETTNGRILIDRLGRDKNFFVKRPGTYDSTYAEYQDMFSLTSSHLIESPVRHTGRILPMASAVTRHSGISQANLYFQNDFSSRGGDYLEKNSRALVNGHQRLEKEGKVAIGASSTSSPNEIFELANTGSNDLVSPYILFPEDEIIIGFQYPLQNFYHTLPSNATSTNSIRFTGPGKITLFGSQIKENKEFHDTLNQNLTTLGVHEAIHFDNPTLDQFLIATEYEYSGSYMDDYITGSVGSTVRSIIGSGENVLSSSFQRFRAFDNKQQRFYDTVLPSVEDIFIAEGKKLQNISDSSDFNRNDFKRGSASTTISGETNLESWLFQFPFQPRPKNVPRKINQKFLLQTIDREDSLALGGPGDFGSGINGSFLGTPYESDSTIVPDFRLKGSLDVFFSFGRGANGRHIRVQSSGPDRYARPAGMKYGLLNFNPQFTKNIYRGDKFGQRADMLEQAQDSRFLVGSSFTSNGPIRIRFVVDDDDDEYIILDEDEILENTSESSNVSIYATSSLPFFDEDTPRNRTYNNTLFANRIIDIIGFNS